MKKILLALVELGAFNPKILTTEITARQGNLGKT